MASFFRITFYTGLAIFAGLFIIGANSPKKDTPAAQPKPPPIYAGVKVAARMNSWLCASFSDAKRLHELWQSMDFKASDAFLKRQIRRNKCMRWPKNTTAIFEKRIGPIGQVHPEGDFRPLYGRLDVMER